MKTVLKINLFTSEVIYQAKMSITGFRSEDLLLFFVFVVVNLHIDRTKINKFEDISFGSGNWSFL